MMKPANVSQCGIAASDLHAAIPHMTSSYEHAYHWSNCYRGALEEDRPALSIPFSRSPALLTQRKAGTPGWVSIVADADAMYLVKTRRAFTAYTITPIMPWEGSLALHWSLGNAEGRLSHGCHYRYPRPHNSLRHLSISLTAKVDKSTVIVDAVDNVVPFDREG